MQAGGAPREAGLTRLRFLFIAWVVLYHLDLPLHVSTLAPWTAPVLQRGYLGVDGFFLLSGFALFLGYGTRPPWGREAVGRFLLRRFAKVWPLHALALLALAAIVGAAMLAGATVRDPERFSVRDFVLQLVLVNAWETTDHYAWNYPSWALSVEWAGYLLFPVILRALLAAPRAAVPWIAAAGFGGLWALEILLPGAGLNLTLHLGLLRFGCEFVAGLALGRLAAEGRVGAAWWPVLALPLGLALDQAALAVMGLAALILAARAGWLAAPGRGPVLRLGEASFGIYLCWIFVEAALVGVLRVTDPGLGGRALLMAGGFVATLAAGWLAWRWVEVPANAWILSRSAPAATPKGATA